MSRLLKHPLWLALLIQLMVLLLLKFTTSFWHGWLPIGSYVVEFLLWQSLLVVLLSYLVKLPSWWWWLQAMLPIGLYWGATQQWIDPIWFGLLTLLLMLVFSAVLKDRVPLYLTNRSTQMALQQLAQEYDVQQAIDLGSGLGGVVRALARQGIDAKGVEYSPLLAWLSNLICRLNQAGQVVQGDMWQTDISKVDMVYVFLSPEPMNRLWQKAQAEMKSGSLLVSNSFAIDAVEAEEVWELNDARQTRLFIYRID